MANDYYKLLDVERTASTDEISKAYRKLARKFHPDLNQDDKNAKKRFQEVQQAYDCLNDPEKRKMYDQFGEDYEKYGSKNPFGGGQPSGSGAGGGGFDFGDIFGRGGVDLGDIFGQMGGGQPRSRRAAQPRGADISAEISVPLKTIVHGGETRIQFDQNGKLESISVKIPAGIEPGKKVRLRGQGQPSSSGKPGDLILKVNLEPHPFFKIVGNNLELRLPISIPEAVRGARIDVPTPAGTVTLTIPPMSNSGKKLRIKGQGMKGAGGVVGDMVVELMIRLPEQIPEDSSASIEQLVGSYTKPIRDGVHL